MADRDRVVPGKTHGDLPWWTWLAPLVIFQLGTQASLHFQVAPGTSIWYLPIPLGFALIYWWGPRVLLGLYCNALVSVPLWGLEQVALYPLYAVPETLEVALSWALMLFGRRLWRSDDVLPGFLAFVLLAILVPVLLGGSLTQAQLVLLGDLPAEDYLWTCLNGITADLLGGLAVTVPLVAFLTGRLRRVALVQSPTVDTWTCSTEILPPVRSGAFVFLLTTLIVVLALGCWLPVQRFWPLYSLPTLLAAIALGFSGAIWANSAVVAATLLLPTFLPFYGQDWHSDDGLLDAHIALVTLSLAVSVTGCAISSLRQRIRRERAMQEEVAASRKQLEQVVRAMPVLLIACDASGQVVAWNHACEVATGYHRADLDDLDQLLITLCPEMEQRDRARRIMAANDVEVQGMTCDIIAVDGRRRTISWSNISGAVPIAGWSTWVVGIDISERVMLEEELRHREKMDAIGRLAGGVAHDFNNMLGGIIGAAEILGLHLGDRDERAQRYLSLIIDSANRSAELTSSLLTFARKGPVVTEAIDMHRLITEVVALLERTIDRRVQVVTQLQAAHCQIVGDQAVLQSALLNMGINAAQAISGVGTLTITTAVEQLDTGFCRASRYAIEPGPFLVIELQDDGCGIAVADIDRIFEPFYTTKAVGSGTGLGLAAVQSMVVRHHGAISVASELGQGTCFQIHLPLGDVTESTPSPSVSIIHGRGHILLVDDEPAMRETARVMLTDLGYTVQTAEDGRTAVDRFSRSADDIDLVVLDMIMPKMDGRSCFEALQAIRADVRVLLTSGFVDEADLDAMRTRGLIGCVRKPYRYGTFSQAVHQALAGTPEPAAPGSDDDRYRW